MSLRKVSVALAVGQCPNSIGRRAVGSCTLCLLAYACATRALNIASSAHFVARSMFVAYPWRSCLPSLAALACRSCHKEATIPHLQRPRSVSVKGFHAAGKPTVGAQCVAQTLSPAATSAPQRAGVTRHLMHPVCKLGQTVLNMMQAIKTARRSAHARSCNIKMPTWCARSAACLKHPLLFGPFRFADGKCQLASLNVGSGTLPAHATALALRACCIPASARRLPCLKQQLCTCFRCSVLQRFKVSNLGLRRAKHARRQANRLPACEAGDFLVMTPKRWATRRQGTCAAFRQKRQPARTWMRSPSGELIRITCPSVAESSPFAAHLRQLP